MVKVLKLYGIGETTIAADRFCSLPGKGMDEFLEFIGFMHPFIDDVKRNWPSHFQVGIGMRAHRRMEALLSDHWRALVKAALIRDEDEAKKKVKLCR